MNFPPREIFHSRYSRMLFLIVLVVAALTIWMHANKTIADEKTEIDLSLILAVDCSHSVSALEYDLQMRGLAQAFTSAEIISAIEGKMIAIMLVQWSGSSNQIISIPWQLISNRDSAYKLATEITNAPRLALGKTSISAVIDFSVKQFSNNLFTPRRQTIDISADGVNNDGASIEFARQRAMSAGITINGLTILNDVQNLDSYFEQFVIGGPGSFTIKANHYKDYASAIKRKLLREIIGLPVS